MTYSPSSVLFEKEEPQWFGVIDEQGVSHAVKGKINHELEAQYEHINLDILNHSKLEGILYLDWGVSLGYYLNDKYKQSERIIEPDIGTFENDSRTRLFREGKIPDFNSWRLNSYFGLSLDFAEYFTVYLGCHSPILAPVIGSMTDNLPFSNDFAWYETTLEIGVSFMLSNFWKPNCDDYTKYFNDYSNLVRSIKSEYSRLKKTTKEIFKLREIKERIKNGYEANKKFKENCKCCSSKIQTVKELSTPKIPNYDYVPQ